MNTRRREKVVYKEVDSDIDEYSSGAASSGSNSDSDDSSSSSNKGSVASECSDGDFDDGKKGGKRKRGAAGAKRVSKPRKSGTPAKRAPRKRKNDDDDEPRKKPRKPAAAPRKPKEMSKLDRVDMARRAHKWWETEKLPEGVQWKSLCHNGVSFPPSYIPHGINLLYNGKPVTLTPREEEIATMYAAMPLDGPQLAGDALTVQTFQKNFFKEFKEVLLPSTHGLITEFDMCDFGPIRDYLGQISAANKARSNTEKDIEKTKKDMISLRYGYCIIDGRLEKVGNTVAEPPGLFRGRGKHPQTGRLKPRIMPEDVTINIDEYSAPPIPSYNDVSNSQLIGHCWNEVRHDNSVTWLANWKIAGGTSSNSSVNKYVMLAASSRCKGQSDFKKYGKAIELSHHIDDIRNSYYAKLDSDTLAEKELAVAMWLIDVLALRVGGEKDDKTEADTVGSCSLRVEHFKWNDEDDDSKCMLEFLGKDSMMFSQTIDFGRYGRIGAKVNAILKSLVVNKVNDALVFENIKPDVVNSFLHGFMSNLTAKVFRTYNASVTLECELDNFDERNQGLDITEMVNGYTSCNKTVAILCNHQKTVSKAQLTTFQGLNNKLVQLKRQKEEIELWLSSKPSKSKSSCYKTRQQEEEERRLEDETNDAKEQADDLREKADSLEKKLEASSMISRWKELRTSSKLYKEDIAHKLPSKHDDDSDGDVDEQLKKRLATWEGKIRRAEEVVRNKDETKEVSLGTSKINYMDPRITAAWCKRHEIPIERMFARTLRDKFNWAMNVPMGWRFVEK